jgi:hypothetical protein
VFAEERDDDVFDRFDAAFSLVWAISIRVTFLAACPTCSVGDGDRWKRASALLVLLATIGAFARLALTVAITTLLRSLVLTLACLAAVWTVAVCHARLVHHHEQLLQRADRVSVLVVFALVVGRTWAKWRWSVVASDGMYSSSAGEATVEVHDCG